MKLQTAARLIRFACTFLLVPLGGDTVKRGKHICWRTVLRGQWLRKETAIIRYWLILFIKSNRDKHLSYNARAWNAGKVFLLRNVQCMSHITFTQVNRSLFYCHGERIPCYVSVSEFSAGMITFLITNNSCRGEQGSSSIGTSSQLSSNGWEAVIFKGRGAKVGGRKREKNTWRVCLCYQQQTESLLTYTYRRGEQPASDKRSRLENDVWREGLWRKEVELKRRGTPGETLREGKGSGTQGGLLQSQK